jgi:caffeoyl-CoA O-methyltransferase
MIDSIFEEYASNHSTPEAFILKNLYRETNLKLMNPRMLSGHLQGKLLEMISCMIQPQQVLEIGTFTGYSAINLSKGLKEGGKIHTIEINAELGTMIRRYFDEANLTDKINLYIGDALDIIPAIEEEFDLVFIDADKENYIDYFNLIIKKVRVGGFIIADNVLWNGKVLSTPHPNDKDTIALQQFNEFILNNDSVDNLLLPFRDGLMLMRKI